MAKTPYSEVKRYAQKRAADMLRARSGHESSLMDCRDYILPDIGQSLSRDPGEVAKDGTRKDSKIINSTPTEAALSLAAGMQSGLTSPSRPWFKLGVPVAAMREVPQVRAWLEAVERILTSVFAQSNIYNVLHDIYLHLGGFGTAAALIVEDDERALHGYVLDQGSYALGADRRGLVTSLYRKFNLALSGLAEEFGEDVLPQTLRDKLRPVAVGNPSRDDDLDITVHCLIEPHSNAIDAPTVRGKPFRAIYWLEDYSDTADDRCGVLAVRGYGGNPILAPRWQVSGGPYGYGPGRRCMGDVRQLQVMESDKLRGLRKLIDPPLAVPDTMRGVPLNTFPGGLTYYGSQGAAAGKPAVTPLYQVQPDLQAVSFVIGQVEQRIRKAFYNDLFVMLGGMDTPRMTAREVVERHEEKLIMLGPVLERLHLELLDALIDRAFQIVADRNLFPVAPEPMQGMPLKVEYISVLASAQRMAGMQTLGQFVSFVGGIAQAIPSVLDKIDADGLIDEAADSLGVPAGVVISDEDAGAIRQARAQKQQQMEQAQQMMAATQAARNLGQANAEPGTALGNLGANAAGLLGAGGAAR
jgi:hypothetical protein